MWYVLRCYQEDEKDIINSLKRHISNQILRDAFVFTYDRMRRYQGEWHVETKKLFPDYIFLESNNGEKLFVRLKQYRGIVRILGDKDSIRRIYPEEKEFLASLGGKYHHLGMSKGYSKNGVTYVKEGPLKGWENRIRKIDRHKRVAHLDAFMIDGMQKSLIAGLEIVEKS